MNTVTDFMLAGDGYSDLAVLVVKTTLIVGLGLIGWKSLGWASASARHLVLGATLVAAILLPLIAAVMPPLNLHVLAPPVQNSAMATATAELPSAGQTISPATDTFARKASPATPVPSGDDPVSNNLIAPHGSELIDLIVESDRAELHDRPDACRLDYAQIRAGR